MYGHKKCPENLSDIDRVRATLTNNDDFVALQSYNFFLNGAKKYNRNVIFLCILLRPRKRSGIDSAELEIRQCRGCLEKFIGNGVCADYSETDHVEALLYYQVLSV